MNILKFGERETKPIYYIMSDQPDCCPKCQSRLELVKVVTIEADCVFVNTCEHCEREFLIVEN